MKISFVLCSVFLAISALPYSLSAFEIKDVKFYLYTKKTTGAELLQIVEPTVDSIKKSAYNAANPTRIIIHGFTANYKAPVIQELKAAYFKRGSFNIIGVDWSAGAYEAYPAAAANTKPVGGAILHFIKAINNNKDGIPNNVVIIGHSLGAHAAGYAGKMTKQIWNKELEVIIGLDPAGFGYSSFDASYRLTDTDAKYVEVIHTCAGCTFAGVSFACGDADFWPNYGDGASTSVLGQPGCKDDVCCHERAYKFYAESLNVTNRFSKVVACPFGLINSHECRTPVSQGIKMGGEPPNKALKGNFYLKTNAVSPFGQI